MAFLEVGRVFWGDIITYLCYCCLFPGSMLLMAAVYLIRRTSVSSSAVAQLGRECRNTAVVTGGSLTRAVLW